MLVSEEKFLCFKDVLSILVIRWRFVSTPKIQKENIMGESILPLKEFPTYYQ